MVVAATYVSFASISHLFSHRFPQPTWRYRYCRSISCICPSSPSSVSCVQAFYYFTHQFDGWRTRLLVSLTLGFVLYHDSKISYLGHWCSDLGYRSPSLDHAHGCVLFNCSNLGYHSYSDCSLHLHCHRLGRSPSTWGPYLVSLL